MLRDRIAQRNPGALSGRLRNVAVFGYADTVGGCEGAAVGYGFAGEGLLRVRFGFRRRQDRSCGRAGKQPGRTQGCAFLYRCALCDGKLRLDGRCPRDRIDPVAHRYGLRCCGVLCNAAACGQSVGGFFTHCTGRRQSRCSVGLGKRDGKAAALRFVAGGSGIQRKGNVVVLPGAGRGIVVMDGLRIGHRAVGSVRAQEVLLILPAFGDVLIYNIYFIGYICFFRCAACGHRL